MQNSIIIPSEVVLNKIYLFRGQKVMLDSDLATLYGVDTKRLNEQVRRNPARFPEDFMFQLNIEEYENLKSQNATSSWGGRRKLPYVFTEHGVLMLSSVLSSERASQVNIEIVRIFIKLRETLLDNKQIIQELHKIQCKMEGQDEKIEVFYQYLSQFEQQKNEERNRIGFKQKNPG